MAQAQVNAALHAQQEIEGGRDRKNIPFERCGAALLYRRSERAEIEARKSSEGDQHEQEQDGGRSFYGESDGEVIPPAGLRDAAEQVGSVSLIGVARQRPEGSEKH